MIGGANPRTDDVGMQGRQFQNMIGVRRDP